MAGSCSKAAAAPRRTEDAFPAIKAAGQRHIGWKKRQQRHGENLP
jgi:hypothetical protein